MIKKTVYFALTSGDVISITEPFPTPPPFFFFCFRYFSPATSLRYSFDFDDDVGVEGETPWLGYRPSKGTMGRANYSI